MKKIFLLISIIIFAAGCIYCDQSNSEVNKTTTSILGPRLQYYLPNGKINVLFKQETLGTFLDFKTEYDYINDYIHTDLDISYPFKRVIVGIGLLDYTDFNQLFDNKNTLQRSKYIKPYTGYRFTEKASVILSTKFQNTYTVFVDSQVVLDSGKNIVQSVGVHYENLSRSESIEAGYRASFDVSKSYDQFGSQYDYTLGELNFIDITRPVLNHYLETRIFMGYPISVIKKPITELYYLGGENMLKGYSYREFAGDAVAYAGLIYHIPIKEQEKYYKTSVNFLSLDILAELGKTGPQRIFEIYDDYKASAGIGSSFDMTILNRIQTKIAVSVNQAFHSKELRYYLQLSAISYLR